MRGAREQGGGEWGKKGGAAPRPSRTVLAFFPGAAAVITHVIPSLSSALLPTTLSPVATWTSGE